MNPTLDRLIELTNQYLGNRGDPDAAFIASPTSAVCQDCFIYGVDVDDYVCLLEEEFGPVVRHIPWLAYTDQTSSYRGCAIALFPLVTICRAPLKLFFGRSLVPAPDPRHFGPRLTLRHIAHVIDEGHWSEP